MVLATCRLDLYLHGVSSLKEKRGIVKPLVARLHREFNVSAAEVQHQDVWQTAGLAVALVTTDRDLGQAVLESIVRWIETHRPDVEIQDYRIEIL